MLTVSEKIKIFAGNSHVHYIREYPAGFVPNSYRWPAPAIRYRTNRNLQIVPEKYDRKRSYGRGLSVVVVSKKGGVLKNLSY